MRTTLCLILDLVTMLALASTAAISALDAEKAQATAEFYRALYIQTAEDAKAVNCAAIDVNYVICERAKR